MGATTRRMGSAGKKGVPSAIACTSPVKRRPASESTKRVWNRPQPASHANLQVDGADRVDQQHHAIAEPQGVIYRMQHAVLGGQPADEKPAHLRAPQLRIEIGAPEARVGVGLGPHRLGNHLSGRGEGKGGREFGAAPVCDAMRRPNPALLAEGAVICGMPVTGGEYRQSGGCEARYPSVQRRHHLVSRRYGQATPGQEDDLDVDDQKRVALL